MVNVIGAKFTSPGVCELLLPGAESILSASLFLKLSSALQLDWTGDESHLTALLHQTSYPPVIIILLLAERHTLCMCYFYTTSLKHML